ncbi:hypothetical protein [Lapidilactobacillus luobeiensis]|uniref:hypothetical protein n=1 Tax=Lapidilactobacillus luobeiensis TaxID=2950371 RepID=UPI0021C34442|nr:hypothetical protein [Lapidilactobacillus luobeiensis]
MVVNCVAICHFERAGIMAWQLSLLKTVERAEWSVAGEIAVSLFLAALPLRIRLSFEIRALCEAQSDAHSELTRQTQRRPRPRLEQKRHSELTPNHAVKVTAKMQKHS